MTTLHDLMIRTPGLPCRDDPEPFFSDHPIDRHYAASLCHTCPLLLACGQYATQTRQQFGVWGGMDLHTRELGCGTNRGFFAHCGRGETPCAPCRAAHEEALAEDRRRRLDVEHRKGGTVWGYQLHRKLGERACAACRTANSQMSARWRARGRGAAERAVTPLGDRRVAEEPQGRQTGAQPLPIAS